MINRILWQLEGADIPQSEGQEKCHKRFVEKVVVDMGFVRGKGFQ